MSQIGMFGTETPLDELDLGPVQKLLVDAERRYFDPLTADEAGAIIHQHQGKHDEDTRCRFCATDGRRALDRLHARASSEPGSCSVVQPEESGSLAPGSLDAPRPGAVHADAGDTERAAAARIAPRSGTARAKVLDAILSAGERGLTDEEAATVTELRLYTAAPRRKELVDAGYVRDSGQRRPTTSGSAAIVWVAT